MADTQSFDENAGTNKLANVLCDRMKREGETPLTLDFGEIQANGSLTTNTFPVSIPRGEYSICRHVGGLSFTISGGGHSGHENQTPKPQPYGRTAGSKSRRQGACGVGSE